MTTPEIAPGTHADEEENAEKEVAERRYDSLSQALAAHRIPLENHATIKQLTDGIGIAGYYGRDGYIKAVRTGEGPSLHISFGYTNGFRSEDEVFTIPGDHKPWNSARATGLWGVAHPVKGHQSGGAATDRTANRDYGTCPECFMKFSAQLTCDCDS